MSDIGACFQPKNHPEVKNGSKLAQNVLNEFFQNLNKISNNGYLTLDQFIDFYYNIGAFEEDEPFENLMKSLWKLGAPLKSTGTKSLKNLSDTLKSSATSVSSSSAQIDAYLPVLQQFKAAVKARGAYGIIGIGRAFRIIDDDGSKSLSISEFKKAVSEYGLSLSELEMNQLFSYFDKDKSGSIEYEEFLQALRV